MSLNIVIYLWDIKCICNCIQILKK